MRIGRRLNVPSAVTRMAITRRQNLVRYRVVLGASTRTFHFPFACRRHNTMYFALVVRGVPDSWFVESAYSPSSYAQSPETSTFVGGGWLMLFLMRDRDFI
jgi:hypothetical protein